VRKVQFDLTKGHPASSFVSLHSMHSQVKFLYVFRVSVEAVSEPYQTVSKEEFNIFDVQQERLPVCVSCVKLLILRLLEHYKTILIHRVD
jgi:hypothetical protein